MKHEITSNLEFSASHAIRLYDGRLEKHHEHVWKLRVIAGSDRLDSIGVVMDFHLLNRLIREIVKPWNGKCLNDMSEFLELNPTAENVAMAIAGRLKLPGEVRLLEVEVWETPTNSAIFRV